MLAGLTPGAEISDSVHALINHYFTQTRWPLIDLSQYTCLASRDSTVSSVTSTINVCKITIIFIVHQT